MKENNQQPYATDSNLKNNSFIKEKPWILVIVIIALLMTAGLSLWLIGRNDNSSIKDTDIHSDTSAKKSKSIINSTTITSEAAMVKILLEFYKTGGNANGIDIPAHSYYPSTADIKNVDWSKKNMNIEDDTHKLISTGKIVYETKGCKTDQPSSDKNKCSGYILSVDDKKVAEE